MAMALAFNEDGGNNAHCPFSPEEIEEFTGIQRAVKQAWKNVERETGGNGDGSQTEAEYQEVVANFQEICNASLTKLDALISEASDEIAKAMFLEMRAACCYYLNKGDDCKQAYEEAFKICEIMLAPTHPLRLAFALTLAGIYFKTNSRNEAREVLDKALAEAKVALEILGREPRGVSAEYIHALQNLLETLRPQELPTGEDDGEDGGENESEDDSSMESSEEGEDESENYPSSDSSGKAFAGPSTSGKRNDKYSKKRFGRWAKKRYTKLSEKRFVKKAKKLSKVVLKGFAEHTVIHTFFHFLFDGLKKMFE